MIKWILALSMLVVFLPLACNNPTPTAIPLTSTPWPTKPLVITPGPTISISPVPTVGAEVLPAPYPARADFVPGRLLVKPKTGYQVEAKAQIGNLGIYMIEFAIGAAVDPYITTLAKMSELRQSGRFEWVETDSIVHVLGDPYIGRQYHLRTTSVTQAWSYTKGQGVRVAVIDTGYDRNHPDLAGQVIAERDYVNNDNYADDDHGHGTHVSGIIFAKAGNGQGGAGVCPECRGMVCKALAGDGSGSVSNVSRCIIWSSGSGADIINLSLGGPQSSNTMLDAVRQANIDGAVVIAAAGNNGSTYPQYPAAYAIAVAAVDQYDRRASWSNYGGYIDVSAPGVSVWSTLLGGRYGPMSGTSMASPVAAGVAALIKAQNPSRGVTEVETILKDTGDDIDQQIGKRVNALSAMLYAPRPTATPGTVIPTPSSTPIIPTATPMADVEGRLHQLINDYRVSQGLSVLVVDDRLIEASRVQSKDMAANSFCGHYGSDGSNPFDRMQDAGYPLLTGGEIVACGYMSADDTFQGWLSSPGHRAIIVGNYNDFGCGHAEGGSMRTYDTCDFARPSGPIPTPHPTITPTAEAPGYDYCLGCTDVLGPDQCRRIACP